METFIHLFQIVLFLLLLATVAYLLSKRIGFIKRNISLGKSSSTDPKDNPARLKTMLMLAFGQKQMFDRPLVGFLHFAVYAGFLLINIEILEIVLDGVFGTHRLFAPYLGGLYPVLLGFFELMGVFVILSCAIFLVRRNGLRIPRFKSIEMKGFPTLDANLILIFEIVLMTFLLTMNASDSILQVRGAEHYVLEGREPIQFLISQFFIPIFEGLGTTSLIVIERAAWWLHIAGIFGFTIYVTYSKHLHIALAFPTTYFSNMNPKGEMENMDNVTKEVKISMGILEDDGAEMSEDMPSFGAKDIKDLDWKTLMSAYSCTECGRCTSVCPANLTGKKLSPRKIMMDIRDRTEEVGKNIDTKGAEFEDEKSLYGDYVSKEELMACTSCNACAEACPININPLGPILEMRRYVAMEEASVPDAWKSMLSNVQNNAAPWAFSASDRFKWAEEMEENQK
jgi:heterodisulfide reductase subunit C